MPFKIKYSHLAAYSPLTYYFCLQNTSLILKILTDRQIREKIKRLAIEILERNYEASELILAGMNNTGLCFARLLMEELLPLLPPEMNVTLTRIRLNPANPLEYAPYIEMPAEQLNGKNIIITDDVANTGRTIFYAIQPLLHVLPKKVEVAVLVDRTHKQFPVKADYVGLSLATTLLENIQVNILNTEEFSVELN